MTTDPIADLLTRIRNAQRAGHFTVRIRKSNMAERILAVLKEEGFIAHFELKQNEGSPFQEFEAQLKYTSTGAPMIHEARRASRPGRRMYARGQELPKIHHGLGIALISTSQGVMSDRAARQKQIGGEVLAYIG